MEFKKSTMAYFLGRTGKLKSFLAPPEERPQDEKDSGQTSKVKMGKEELFRSLMEVRALIGRLGALDLENQKDNQMASPIEADLAAFLDGDILGQIEDEIAPDQMAIREYQSIKIRLENLLSNEEVLQNYHDMYESIAKNRAICDTLSKAYQTGKLGNRNLNASEKTAIARQLIRTLKELLHSVREEIQNIHNQVATEKRDYVKTDREVLGKLKKWEEKIEVQINDLISRDHEVAIQIRMDEIAENSRILKRNKVIDRKTQGLVARGNGYIETDSRRELIYGTEGPDNYVLGCLRNGNHVEMLGPTGTGKTQVAIHAAKVFSGKSPVVVSGGPGVYKSTFFGAPKGLDKRDPGAVIKCFTEDRILIIDEDNRVDPRQMAEIKYILGLRPGDEFIHPDTGEALIIPPHFRIMVTRNEAGKHHKDRFDLPPEYRREFTHGSFEVDYYTPAEMYDEFLLPKLRNEDGSISLSKEEIGENSPLHALVMAAAEIQKDYKDVKLKNAVFESGYLIGLLDQWREMQFKTRTDVSGKKKSITFQEYLETKLLEFIRRPIGNSDRKIIVQKLYNQGFFRQTPREKFSTANEGEIFTVAEFQAMTQGSSNVFKTPQGNIMTPQEVALLDPFKRREIKVPVHPLEKEIGEMNRSYGEFCRKHNLRKITFTPHGLETARGKVIEQLKKFATETGHKNLSTLLPVADAFVTKPLADFLKKWPGFIMQFDQAKSPREDEPNTAAEAIGLTRNGIIKLFGDSH